MLLVINIFCYFNNTIPIPAPWYWYCTTIPRIQLILARLAPDSCTIAYKQLYMSTLIVQSCSAWSKPFLLNNTTPVREYFVSYFMTKFIKKHGRGIFMKPGKYKSIEDVTDNDDSWQSWLDRSVHNQDRACQIVPVFNLGYMCHILWKQKVNLLVQIDSHQKSFLSQFEHEGPLFCQNEDR